MNDLPKISIITPSFNTGRFLEDTIKSILAESFTDYEHIVVDAGSTDNTVEILKKYPHIRWVSEKDDDYWEGFSKGLAMARGEYVMNLCVSDGYLDKDWLKKCVEVLEHDPEVSLVWGLTRYMTEDGKLGEILYKQFLKRSAPQKIEFFYYWLATYDSFPENNLCARANVFRACWPPYKKEYATCIIKEFDAWNEFVYAFHSQGYLSWFLPTIANYGRIHGGQRSENERKAGLAKIRYGNYLKKIRGYRRALLAGKAVHRFLGGDGATLPQHFSRKKFLREQVFSPYGMRRAALRAGAAITRPIARWTLENEGVPAGLKKFIKKLKGFYGVRQ
jgi:glycosyltransferase involved in cell wall biosynthesis